MFKKQPHYIRYHPHKYCVNFGVALIYEPLHKASAFILLRLRKWVLRKTFERKSPENECEGTQISLDSGLIAFGVSLCRHAAPYYKIFGLVLSCLCTTISAGRTSCNILTFPFRMRSLLIYSSTYNLLWRGKFSASLERSTRKK